MTDSDGLDKPTRGRLTAGLLLICALAIALRGYHVWRAVVISPDSALFIAYAQALADEPLDALRQFDQHPLYPALILLFHGAVGWLAGTGPSSWILAGRLAAIAGSLGSILAMYWLVAGMYDRRRGLLAAAMLALLPDACRIGADVLSDLPQLALYLTGLAALLAGMRRERLGYLLLAAAAAGLAFLTRPEGAAVLPVGVAVLAFQFRWPVKRRVGYITAMVAVFFCFVGPYQLATGKLIQKKSLFEMLKFGPASRVEHTPSVADVQFPRETRPSSARESQAALATTLPVPVNVVRQWIRAGRVVYILLAILGLVVARPRGVGRRILALALGIHILLLYALETRHGYLDRRHALILVTLSLPLAAAGVWWLAELIAKRATAARATVQLVAAVGILAACAAGTGPWLLRPINPGEEHVVASARWLAEHTPPGSLIVTDSRLRRVTLYADREYAEWPWWQGGVNHLARFLSEKLPDSPECYFVVDKRHITLPERNPVFFEQLEEQLGDRLELLRAEPSPPSARHSTEIRIYRYLPPPPRPAPT